jgi:hypothetical protein
MSRRAATITQADVARVIRAAKQALSIDPEHGYGSDVPRASPSGRFGGPVGNFKPRLTAGLFLWQLPAAMSSGLHIRRVELILAYRSVA